MPKQTWETGFTHPHLAYSHPSHKGLVSTYLVPILFHVPVFNRGQAQAPPLILEGTQTVPESVLQIVHDDNNPQ